VGYINAIIDPTEIGNRQLSHKIITCYEGASTTVQYTDIPTL